MRIVENVTHSAGCAQLREGRGGPGCTNQSSAHMFKTTEMYEGEQDPNYSQTMMKVAMIDNVLLCSLLAPCHL